MDLSWAALFFILVLVTPALPLVLLFRFFFPKSRTISLNEATLFLLCGLVSVFCNWTLIGAFSSYIITLHPEIFGSAQVVAFLRDSVTQAEYAPLEFWPAIGSYWIDVKANSPNLFFFILDLQTRPFLVGFGLIVFSKCVTWCDQYFQALPFIYTSKAKKNLKMDRYRECLMFVAATLGYGSEVVNKDQRRPGAEPSWITKLISYVQDSIYHPWNLLTEQNKMREILVADVATDKAGLFSGVFTSWIAEGEAFSGISIVNTLHYWPEEEPKKEPAQTEGDASELIANPPIKQPSKSRKTRLVRNQGEMIIGAEHIESIHFWEIRRCSKLVIGVSDRSSFEMLKWYMVLAEIEPEYFQSISVQFLSADALETYAPQLNAWLEDCEIEIDLSKFSYQTFVPVPEKAPEPAEP